MFVTLVLMNIPVFWDMALCSLDYTYYTRVSYEFPVSIFRTVEAYY